MKILFYPPFETKEDLADYVYRASWYFSPLTEYLSEVVFAFNGDITLDELPDPAPEMAPDLKDIAKGFSAVKIINIGEGELPPEYLKSDYFCVHKEATRNDFIKTLDASRKSKIVRVDKEAVQFADSFFLRFYENFPESRAVATAMAKDRIAKFLTPLKQEKSYLFGTGPNFSFVEGYDFSDGLVIACNSIAANAEILDQLNPDIFVIADPIFHAGPSSYAYSFRTALEAELKKRDCPLVVPLRDYHVYKRYLSADLQERLIPIDFVAGSTPNLDVFAAPEVTTTSNIVTLFQIPLGASLSDKLYISGCDGRPLKDNGYFWSHNKKVQFNDRMDDIQRAHPSFFNISYDDYYNTHIEIMETWIATCEAQGKSVFNLTPSYIPALQKRQSPELLPHVHASVATRNATASIIVPSFNSAQYLEECVQSILDQNCDNVEIIIVDDFSDDQSFAMAKELAEKFDNIRVIQNFRTKGVSGARNTGLEIAVGEFIGFLDADDTLPNGSLKARIERMQSDPDCNIVHSHCRMVNTLGHDLGIELYEHRDITFKQMSGSGSHFNTIMVRASKIRDLLHFPEDFANGEDWLAFARLLRLGEISKYVPEGWANYRVHPTSTVLKDMAGHEAKLRDIIEWLYRPVPAEESVAAYADGLTHPTKDMLLSNRKVGQLVFYVLSGDVDKVNQLMSDTSFRKHLSTVSEGWRRRVSVPIVRATGRHIDQLADAAPDIVANIQIGLSALEKHIEANGLVDALNELCQFDKQNELLARVTKSEGEARSLLLTTASKILVQGCDRSRESPAVAKALSILPADDKFVRHYQAVADRLLN